MIVRRGWLLPSPAIALACSGPGVDSAQATADAGTELIPAEWTIAEDTSETGEVITKSMQLPVARYIAGLMDEQSPRLMLRCIDGKVAAFIDTTEQHPDLSSSPEPISVPLDSAPPCE
jgi:hypothetical protein